MSGRRAPAVILCRTQMGENIGTAARAMLNFGLTELRLVAPQCGWPNAKAVVAASGAVDVLEPHRAVSRPRRRHRRPAPHAGDHRPAARDAPSPCSDAEARRRQCARLAVAEGRRVGIVFGPERTGLTNDELLLADALVSYPVNPAFASLNLAQAVLLFGYAWFRQTTGDAPVPIAAQAGAAATKAELGGLVDHLVRELDAVELLSRRGAPGQPDPHDHGDAGAPPMDRRGGPSDARHHQGSGRRA